VGLALSGCRQASLFYKTGTLRAPNGRNGRLTSREGQGRAARVFLSSAQSCRHLGRLDATARSTLVGATTLAQLMISPFSVEGMQLHQARIYQPTFSLLKDLRRSSLATGLQTPVPPAPFRPIVL
jgi:hypothetical protein